MASRPAPSLRERSSRARTRPARSPAGRSDPRRPNRRDPSRWCRAQTMRAPSPAASSRWRRRAVRRRTRCSLTAARRATAATRSGGVRGASGVEPTDVGATSHRPAPTWSRACSSPRAPRGRSSTHRALPSGHPSDRDDQQDHHQGTDHGPGPHPSTHPSAEIVHHRGPQPSMVRSLRRRGSPLPPVHGPAGLMPAVATEHRRGHGIIPPPPDSV